MATNNAVYPTLRCKDVEQIIAFLTGTLGLTEQAVARDDGGMVVHAELRWGDGVIMLGPSSGDNDPFDLGRVCLYLSVEDPDAHHDRAAAAGAEIMMPLTDQPYGSREYAVRDPEGNIWCFGTYRP